MKVSSTTTTTTRTLLSPKKAMISPSTDKSNPHLLATETKRLERVSFVDFIRGDTRFPERYVFSPDLFPDYLRATQRRLVAMIQQVCEAQNSPVSVHQWATEEHDDRVVRRIRFRCAFFRKKKRAAAGTPSCGFQFQVCYQAKYGWCMLNGKGQSRHSGHPLANTKPQNQVKPSPTKAARASLKKATPKRSLPALKAVPVAPVAKTVPATPTTCLDCTAVPQHHVCNDENHAIENLCCVLPAETPAWKDFKQTSTLDCKVR